MPEVMEKLRERTLELGVYLPLGAVSATVDRLAELDPRDLRRTYRHLVDRGQRRFDDLMNGTRKAVRSEVRDLERRSRQTRERLSRAGREISDRGEAAVGAISPTVEGVAVPASSSELPIDDYDSLTAQRISGKLDGLTQTELARVYRYEEANQSRSTILKAIRPKLVNLPIPTYDALTVDEILHRLETLSQEELRTLRGYEQDTKGRTTVLRRIDELLG